MQSIFKSRRVLWNMIIFIILNTLLYVWMSAFHGIIPFQRNEYATRAHHYKVDPRIDDNNFSLLNALGQYDSQWYLKIAEQGYPKNPKEFSLKDKTMDGMRYNFFPLLPLLLFVINLVISNIEVSAYIISNVLLLAIFFSLHFVVSRWFSPTVAYKTIFLVALFPFSIFLRGYYTEGLRLLLFIWFCFGVQQKRLVLAAVCLGLLSITNGVTLGLLPYFFYVLTRLHKNDGLSKRKVILYSMLTCLPFAGWVTFVFFQTGNPLYFLLTRSAWQRPVFPLIHNLLVFSSFPQLPLRAIYGSQIDVMMIFGTMLLAFLSRKLLHPQVWLATLILAFTPLVLQDTVSFARFTPVLFPFFVYIGYAVRGKYYVALLLLCSIGLLTTSLLFVNWYWIE